jgi:2-polyprenyl-6-methoxyphenol hydroxylase-like FAD-dependent oxidoreductase
MTDHAVVVAGGGPTGMMLAGELALAGVDVVIVERRATRQIESSRAGGLYARTLEVLDQRGIVERFVAEGQVMQLQGFAYVPLDISDLPTRHNYGLALWQREFERILAGWIDELAVPVLQGREVVGLRQDDHGVDVVVDSGSTLRCDYLVGCDGGRSTVRKAAGIEFDGLDASISFLIAEVHMTEEPQVGVRREGGGIGPVDPQLGGNPYRVVLKEQGVDHLAAPTLDDVREALVAAYGTDYGAHDPTWVSRFTDATRQARVYRSGRVLLAGDAAHIHAPHGGQGLNTGVQDAVNLGWKLAQVVHGTSPIDLLDTYHTERHPVAARVLQNTMAQVALTTPDDRHDALRSQFAELLTLREARTRIAAMITGLDICYDVGGAHPLVGRRIPDLDLSTSDGPTRAYALLHDGRPLLLELSSTNAADLGPWSDRVRSVVATYDGTWELPVVGAVAAPSAVLVRPDGHVAWVGEVTDPALFDALSSWFGPPRAPRRATGSSRFEDLGEATPR